MIRLFHDKQYDFFLWSCGVRDDYAERLANDLNGKYKFTVNNSWEQSLLAEMEDSNALLRFKKEWLEEIHKAVKTSRWTLICLKDGDLDRNKALHTMMASLMDSERCQQACLLLIVPPTMANRLRETEFMKHKKMPDIPIYEIDFNDNDYLRGIFRLCWNMPKIPGCLAHGQVFSHFVGFWSHILPGLQQRMKKSDTYKTTKGTTSTRLYVLLPITKDFQMPCLESPQLSSTAVIKEETLLWKKPHAGKPRKYELQVYKVSKDQKTYYCAAEIPDVLKTIYLMGEYQINYVSVAGEIQRFYNTANMLLSKYFPDTVALLPYNEEDQCKEDVLFKALHKELKTESVTKKQKLQPPLRQFEYDAAVICDEHVRSDRKLSEQLAKKLKNLGTNVCCDTTIKLENIMWHVFVVSNEALRDVEQCMSVLCRISLSGDEMRTILLLRDVHPIDLPSEFKFAFAFRMDEPDVEEKISSAIKGEPWELELALPTGDVASGLAWGYALRYLNLTLGRTSRSPQDFINRVNSFVNMHDVGEGCVSKFFVLCPRSCMTDGVNIVHAGLSKSISHVGTLDAYVEDMGATKGREYRLCVYKYKNEKTNKTLCFVCEYCTAFKCLGEMANKYPFAGLQKTEMYKQCERFVELLPKILAEETVKQKFGDYSQLVELIDFDDHKETVLIDVLEKTIFMREDLPIIRRE